MTTLRFVGDLPVWAGITLAIIVAVMSWRYYRRESFDLSRRLRWFLPLLRSTAFAIGILTLLNPVLHHRVVTGELGKVRIYVDASQSMEMGDPHMAIDRKAQIARQLDWITGEQLESALLTAINHINNAERELLQTVESEDRTEAFTFALKELHSAELLVSPEIRRSITDQLIEPLESMDDTNPPDSKFLVSECHKLQSRLLQEWNKSTDTANSIASMTELAGKTSRWKRVELALTQAESSIVQQLKTKHDVELYSLSGEQAERIVVDVNPETSTTESPLGAIQFSGFTDLTTGVVSTQKDIAQASESESDEETTNEQPNSAVVVISDGNHNSGMTPARMAEIFGSQGVSIYTVATGAKRPAPDQAVVSIGYPDTVFKSDHVRGELVIRDLLPKGTPFVVQVGSQDTVVWQEELVSQNVSERRIAFEFPVDSLTEEFDATAETGMTRHAIPLTLTASISTLNDDAQPDNNQRQFRFSVITKEHRILVLDGRPRWETRYLRNAFERDRQWSVTPLIAGPATDNLVLPRGDGEGQFPSSREALFDYDLIVLGEIDAELLTENELEWISEFVQIRGGGLILVDGRRSKLRGLVNRGLEDLVPVEWQLNAETVTTRALELSAGASQLPALQFVQGESENQRFWKSLPAPRSLLVTEPLPDAEVLVEADSDGSVLPAIVTRQSGAGRVLYFAFDETWRWRYKAADTWHQRFWNQIAAYVMAPPFAVSDDYVAIDSGPLTYNAGETIDLRVRLRGPDGKPSIGTGVDALIWKGERLVSTVSLTEDAEIPGVYRGRTNAPSDGEYEVSVRAAGFSDAALKARSQFVVLPIESGETNTTSANVGLLQQMAESSGGVYLSEEQLHTLPDLLSPLSRGRVEESETMIWQTYWWFSLILILLTVEWILRKRAGLL